MRADVDLDIERKALTSDLLPELIAVLRRGRPGDLVALVGDEPSMDLSWKRGADSPGTHFWKLRSNKAVRAGSFGAGLLPGLPGYRQKTIVRCGHKLLPPSYTLAAKETRSCAEPMKLPADVTSTLDVYSYQHPDGSVTMRKVRTLPSPSELDEQSDQRHLTDYQKEHRPAIKQIRLVHGCECFTQADPTRSLTPRS